MSTLTVIRKIVFPLLFVNTINKLKGNSSLLKIKAAQTYIGGIKKIRTLSLGILFVLLSLVLLGSGLFLIHTALFDYSPWSAEVKFILALVLGGIEFLGAIVILFYFFKEETWARFYGIRQVLDSVVKDGLSHSNGDLPKNKQDNERRSS